MTEFKSLDESFFAAAQIDAQDIARAAADGFEAVVSFRPDGEESDQPDADLVASWAADQGLGFHCLPLVPGQMTQDHIIGLKNIIDNVEGQVLGFCRSGMRAAIMWALVRSAEAEMDEENILILSQKAGYNLTNVTALVSEVRGSLQS